MKISIGNRSIIIITTLICVFLSSDLNSLDNKQWDDIKRESNLRRDEYLVIIHHFLGDCDRCVVKNMATMHCIEKRVKALTTKIKFLAVVFCNRDIELNVFIKQFDWEHHIYRDKGDFKKKFVIDKDHSFFLFNHFGKILLSCSIFESNTCQKVIDIVSD